MDSFSQQLTEIALGHAKMTQAGIEAGRREPVMALRAILKAYDAAGKPAIPTAMLAALEAARKVVE